MESKLPDIRTTSYKYVVCKNCDTKIKSMHRHDFVVCACKSRKKQIFVDGGNDYFRFGYGDNARWEVVY